MDIWGTTKIDFLGKRKISFTISIIFALLGLVAVIAIPAGKANLGTDFAGGIAIQYRFAEAIEIQGVRDLLAESGFRDANLQQFAEQNKLLVKLKRTEGNLGALTASLGAVFSEGMPENPFTIDSTREVGPTVGKKLQRDALWAILVSMLGILVYVAWRFEFRFGVAAVVATFHDVLVVMGLLFLMNKEITLLIVTGLLTIAGYSLTDSVVVFDRIRENMRRSSKESRPELINRSINEVLRRTFVTSITTALALVALLVFGGDVLYDFALTMLMGVIIGTYSSIFIASPLLLFWEGVKKTGLAKS
jgi:preprotein translocase subunit SecF